MRRLDRAMYGVFLLVLLADVARLHASVPVDGDFAGGLILNATGQIGAGQMSAAGRMQMGSARDWIQPRRCSMIASAPGARFSLSGWRRVLPQVFLPSSALLPPQEKFEVALGEDSRLLLSSLVAVSAVTIFEHSTSPAP